ncbi:MAG: amino acid adenylation domain-containing protein [Eggerthellaceae bacterium]|nr:amino acid adenylation domain-containing protein [Eggerthellaceae bacterium]
MENVLEWLEAAARKTPDAVAVADVETQLTFAQLRDGARRVGTFLGEQVAPGGAVALYLEKSTKALCGMLGVVYAGCAYSVLDVRQPAARLASILEKLQPAFVLTDAATELQADAVLADTHYTATPVERALQWDADEEVLAAARSATDRTSPLYVNFTSGSTGTPKGVVVSHGSVIDFIGHFTELFDFTSEDVIANQAPFDFDVSVKDIYGGMAVGAAVHLIPRDYFSVPVQLMDFLCDRRVTVCTWAVSAMCFVSTMNGFDYRTPDTVRIVIFSGEVMPPKHLAKWQAALPHARFVNVYGPTEVTCNCTYWEVPPAFDGDVLPVGKPFPHAEVFLLDDGDALVDTVGKQGQICVAGSGLALGYAADKARTDEAFTESPLCSGQRIYRTGDVGYWDENGNLVYAGRVDHQIKHLGQRIELGEIESVAQSCEGVDRACCLYNDTRKRILLYVVADCGKDALRGYLHDRLPSYMVPSKIVFDDAMPLTKNGKIDRTALAQLQ